MHYHVLARGNARQRIFLDDEDCQRFLMALAHTSRRLDWTVAAYCLMPNHYHLLIQTHTATLARGMRDLNGAYAQGFNRRHTRVGHLFQGRYKAILVENGEYLHALARYIVLNPVRAGLCDAPEDWPWTSYRAAVGIARSDMFPGTAALARHFAGATLEESRQAYGAFVRAGIGALRADPPRAPTGVLGSPQWTRELAEHVPPHVVEVTRAERAFTPIGNYVQGGISRNAAIRAAYETGNFTLVSIARGFGLSISAVSRIARGVTNTECRHSSSRRLPDGADETPRFKT
jgi:REP element-mobilizing transposase RayT